MSDLSVRALTSTRIPTVDGEFRLHLYENNEDDKDHLALVYGDIHDGSDVLVRIHSECFTGDVLGSLRCDCGEQLDASMRKVAEHGSGIILYLRQEGRGIGLLSKLRAYELQDEGFDTVEANHLLGHGADERDYTIGARILEDMGVTSVRLLTNNPEKIESLKRHGISVVERVPLPPHFNKHNTKYLRTKVERMRHLLDVGTPNGIRSNRHELDLFALEERADRHFQATGRPFVTLSYVQSIDGSIATPSGDPLSINGETARHFTRQLRTIHDAVLVDVEAVLDKNFCFNTERPDETLPRFVVLDPQLRFSADAAATEYKKPPILITSDENVSPQRVEKMKEAGVSVMSVPKRGSQQASLEPFDWGALLRELGQRGITSLMVEGRTGIITGFLQCRLVNHLVIAMTPTVVGGTPAMQAGLVSVDGRPDDTSSKSDFPRLENMSYQLMGDVLMMRGDPV